MKAFVRFWLVLLLVAAAAFVPFTLTTGAQAVAPAGPPPPGGTFRALAPARIVDTRTGLGSPTTGELLTDLTFSVVGAHGVPAFTDVSAVVLNLTITGGSGVGATTVYSPDTLLPGTSNVNWNSAIVPAAQGMVVVAPSGSGQVSIHSSNAASFIVDLEGYFTSAATAGTTGLFTALSPTRVLDSRIDATQHALSPGGTARVVMAGANGIPANATAVVVNTTVAQPAAIGFVSDYPAGSSVAQTSTIDFLGGQILANRSIVPIGVDGSIELLNSSTGATNVVLDVTGYFSPSAAGSYFVPTQAGRVFDSRLGGVVPGLSSAQIPSGQVINIHGSAKSPYGGYDTAYQPVPSLDAITKPVAVLGNLTVAGDQPGLGFSVVYPAGSPAPLTSDLDYFPGQTIANSVVVGLGTDGLLDFQTQGSDLILDISGYFALPAPTTVHGLYQSGIQKGVYGLSVPSPTRFTANAVALAAAYFGEYALTAAGSVEFWPKAYDGFVGDLHVPTPATPVVEFTSGVKQIAGEDGSDAIAVLKTDGSVWTSDAPPNVPFAPVTGLTGVTSIVGGPGGFLAIRTDGSVYWFFGEEAAPTSYPDPGVLPGLNNIVSVAASGDALIAVDSSGAVWRADYATWNGVGAPVAVKVSGLCVATSAYSGGQWSYISCADGSIWLLAVPGTPTRITGLSSIKDMTAGPQGDVALEPDGTVWQSHGDQFIQVQLPAGVVAIDGVASAWSGYLFS